MLEFETLGDSDDPINLKDYIIIQNIKKYPYMYDPNYCGFGQKSRSDRISVFKSTSNALLCKIDAELSWEEVEKRWVAMRQGYSRSLRQNKKYYLESHLSFLKPYIQLKEKNPIIETKKENVVVSPTPAVVSSNDLTYEDVLRVENISSKVKKTSTGNNINKENEKEKNEYWQWDSEFEYFLKLKRYLKNLPKDKELQCMAEIFQAGQKYIEEL